MTDKKAFGLHHQKKEFVGAFTVDVEEWFQVGTFEHVISRQDWPTLQSRIKSQVDILLETLDIAGVSATFFCLGDVAKSHPDLIRKISDMGHEIASHGMDHRRIFHLDASRFYEDVKQSRQILEDITCKPVIGYRAPNFSLNETVRPWAYQRLSEAGYRYSSSIYPVKRDHYGDTSMPARPYRVENCPDIVEIPMSRATFAGHMFPASGGGFFRAWPYRISAKLLEKAARQNGTPPVFYMHPWEIDPGQPKISGAPLKSQMRHRLGLSKMHGRVRRLLQEYHWGTVQEIIYKAFDTSQENQ